MTRLSASLTLRVAWESPLFTDRQGQRRPFVEERSITRVHRAEGNIRKIDFQQRLTVLTHPGTAGCPQSWILRARSSMQSAVYPGRHLTPIPRDCPVVLNYRLVLHRGELDAAALANLQAEYAAERVGP